MTRILNLNDFQAALNERNAVEISDVNTRKLINLSSEGTISGEDIEFIKSINSNIFLKAYLELNKPIESTDVVKDLVVTEYAKENLDNAEHFIGDEEIY